MAGNQTVPSGKTAVQQKQNVDTIDLVEVFYTLLGKWQWIVASTLICAIISGVITVFFITPKYQASSTIYVLNRKDSAINMSDLQIGTALTSDYIEVFKMWEVHEKVISNLDLPYTYNQMNSMLSVTNTTDTRMLKISFTSTSAQEAADVANEYAKVVREYIAEKMDTDKPSIMSTALVPSAPISPNKTKNVMLGAMLGLVASCGVIVVIMLLDDTYKTAEDIRKYTGLVTLAEIPLEKSQAAHVHKREMKLPGGKKQ